MAETRIGVIGCAGRMGRMLVRDIVATEGCALAGGLARPGSASPGQDVGELAGLGRIGIAVGDDPERLLGDSDVGIEFTTPAASAEHATLAARLGKPLVIGTTGLHGAEESAVRDAAQHVPIVWAANTSLGVNLLLGLVDQVARRLGPEWDIEIFEAHHRLKRDAPSGTALLLGRAAGAGRGEALEDIAVRGRDGATGLRRPGDIGFSVMRAGGVVGEHAVVFAAEEEVLTLSHSARDRRLFARGAVVAAVWVVGREPGLYDMMDVLGLRGDGDGASSI